MYSKINGKTPLNDIFNSLLIDHAYLLSEKVYLIPLSRSPPFLDTDDNSSAMSILQLCYYN